ncbi:16S rRNA (guanine(966)-N(2))-methyltransferase RsmD [bacterium]|nr:16S rRNA (guanine(966)-N(2))-methyltransferase RsmD [bacterium]
MPPFCPRQRHGKLSRGRDAVRLTGGEGKGRKLASPPPFVRPTSARTREVLFNILQSRIRETSVLDLFAGSGLLGIEALARGAADATFIEEKRPAVQVIQKNLKSCGFEERGRVIQAEVFQWLKRQSQQEGRYELIFADPPYNYPELVELPSKVISSGLLTFQGEFILEVSSRLEIPTPADARLWKRKNLGDTTLLFFTYGD